MSKTTKIPKYEVNVFVDPEKRSSGNPAAVYLLKGDHWPESELLQDLASQANLPESAFVLETEDTFKIRWFSPILEFIGAHSTLAAGYVILKQKRRSEISFDFTEYKIPCWITDDGIVSIRMPAIPPGYERITEGMVRAMRGARPLAAMRGRRDLVLVYPSLNHVRQLEPDMREVAMLDCLSVIATAADAEEGENNCDYGYRVFGPKGGFHEDAASGGAHCNLGRYYSRITGKQILSARAASNRGGQVFIRDIGGDYIDISGLCRLFSQGEAYPEALN